MPRTNRPRRSSRGADDDDLGLERLSLGLRRVENRRDGEWNVQPLSSSQAVKDYICPGCSQSIIQGTAHLVAWRADGILGDASDVAARRHWHAQCWKVRN